MTIRLPQSSGQVELGESLRAVDHPPTAQDGSTHSGAVLLVEDDGLLRRFMQEMLELAGFDVLTAGNGEEALELFERERGNVDVLLTDIVMPRMSGREVAERVRELDPHVGVIYTSGYADDPGTGRDDARDRRDHASEAGNRRATRGRRDRRTHSRVSARRARRAIVRRSDA